jgi:hypothetical protein
MSNSKINQAILRVAKESPEFRKALQAELKTAAKELTEAEVNFLQDVNDSRGRALARKGRMARRMEKDKYVEKVDYGLNVEGWKLTRKGHDALKKTYSWEKKASAPAEFYTDAKNSYIRVVSWLDFGETQRGVNAAFDNVNRSAKEAKAKLDRLASKDLKTWVGEAALESDDVRVGYVWLPIQVTFQGWKAAGPKEWLQVVEATGLRMRPWPLK